MAHGVSNFQVISLNKMGCYTVLRFMANHVFLNNTSNISWRVNNVQCLFSVDLRRTARTTLKNLIFNVYLFYLSFKRMRLMLPCLSSAGMNRHPFPRHQWSCAELYELRVHCWSTQRFYHTSHWIWFTLNHDWNIAVCLKQARNDKVLTIFRVTATFQSQLSNSQVQSPYKDFNILVLPHPVVAINLL